MLAALLGWARRGQADFTYDITVDTSGLADMLRRPAGGTLSSITSIFSSTRKSRTVSNFSLATGSVDGTLIPTGDVGGSLTPGPLALTDDTILDSLIFSQGNVTGSGPPLTFAADNTNGPQINEAFFNVTFGTTVALSLDITPADANGTASLLPYPLRRHR